MTPEDIACVEGSLRELEDRLDGVADRFYDGLFAAHPDLRALFPTDLHQQRAKFAAQLRELLTAIRDLDVFVRTGRELGAQHRAYGVQSRHYAQAAGPLLDSLAEELGERWTDEVAHAWHRGYALVAEVMQQGAARTR